MAEVIYVRPPRHMRQYYPDYNLDLSYKTIETYEKYYKNKDDE